MELKILLALCAIFLGKNADATVSGWTNPTITGADGTGTVAGTLAESTVVGSASITIAATSNVAIASYTITSQSPTTVHFTIANTGLLSVAIALDYETQTSHTLTIEAVDAAPTTGTATVIINIGDVNDNTPAFTAATNNANVRDGSCSATAVATYGATDADGTTANNVITYAISSGNTGSNFAVSSAGLLSVAIGKTVRHADLSMYTLVVTATDSGSTALTGTTTVTVYICSAPTIAVSLLTLFVALLASLR